MSASNSISIYESNVSGSATFIDYNSAYNYTSNVTSGNFSGNATPIAVQVGQFGNYGTSTASSLHSGQSTWSGVSSTGSGPQVGQFGFTDSLGVSVSASTGPQVGQFGYTESISGSITTTSGAQVGQFGFTDTTTKSTDDSPVVIINHLGITATITKTTCTASKCKASRAAVLSSTKATSGPGGLVGLRGVSLPDLSSSIYEVSLASSEQLGLVAVRVVSVSPEVLSSSISVLALVGVRVAGDTSEVTPTESSSALYASLLGILSSTRLDLIAVRVAGVVSDLSSGDCAKSCGRYLWGYAHGISVRIDNHFVRSARPDSRTGCRSCL